ncbi:MAG TPA: transglutaminase family protein [Tepidisphaeraceae bacterium]|nr:transglutaminase family protein [Tepidisphaeraceae bacterium]
MIRPIRRLRIRHTTRYTYDAPIERSSHRLHLRPIDEWRQGVVGYRLSITPAAPVIEYEDVFGNWTQRFEVTEPYTELTISAESEVELSDLDPFGFARLPIRPPGWPLVWMPWERTMLAPYLTPVELPDTQLRALYDYAMEFVRRNDGDLMETLFAINLSLYHDYEYVPGCTDLGTTPYQIYVQRKGVCQDFANLFITLARLVGVPARYVCGYLYTGNSAGAGAHGGARATSDATHAWVQLYIPNIGWKGFDPTNGVLPQADHVRVAYGRHYRDTAPTAGTLYGSANETMSVDVEVSEASDGDHAPRDAADPNADNLAWPAEPAGAPGNGRACAAQGAAPAAH